VKIPKQFAIITVAATLALPAAALAHHGHGTPQAPTGSTGATGSTGSHDGHGKGRCRKPTVNKGYVVSGTYGTAGSFSATKNADGTYTGTVSFTVTHTNRHGTGATAPFSFTGARLTFDSPTATEPSANDHVMLIGNIAVVKHGCTSTTAGTVTIRKIVFSVPSA
jgi:hypothetical protein